MKWFEIIDEIYRSTGFEEEEEKDIKFEFRLIRLYFFYMGKKYVMNFNNRIETIVNYVFTKNIFKPIFEASRGLRYKTIEERTHHNLIDWDMYGYTKTIAVFQVNQELMNKIYGNQNYLVLTQQRKILFALVTESCKVGV